MAVFTTVNGTGAGVLLAFGGILLVLALLAVLAAIKDSRSAFEQDHAVRVADNMLPGLDTTQRQRLGQVIKGAPGLRALIRRSGWESR